ncbi:primosomal protein N' [Microbispora sp. RL4-1S]|uniref:Probable replication restart protein PriA n=1 Tax=Microbispora oryzae TaxID=2806554 RepID=A0A940WJN0_9ACTN|nr:primosomal protein N' [Microbispora oryzae]MBP2702396.1 primosomal protein N' [Microbispora oryzae]
MTEPTSAPYPQEALLPAPEQSPPAASGRPRPRAAKGAREAAESLPVARVVVDTPLPHLDRPFDYLVPDSLDAQAVPGCRVRVRFGGQLADGFLLERAAVSEHTGRLAFLERVVSPEPVLTPEIAGLARSVADRYAGTMSDVLRLAVPPRHARVEAEARTPARVPGEETAQAADGDPWSAYPAGPSFLAALADGRSPRAVWTALPGIGADGPVWPRAIAAAVRATLAGGRGAVVVVPDGKDVALVAEALAGTPHVAITADLGPAERYRRWLKALRGEIKVVVGNRPAAFAPVADLGLAVIWDDGDDLHSDRHAPYPHAREVLGLRAQRADAAMLTGGHTCTAEAALLVATGWAAPLTPDREVVRARAPRVRPTGDDAELARDEAARAARLPSLAWRALRHGLDHGPVLVQVPRRGYLPALACQHCRAPARCSGLPPVALDPAVRAAAQVAALPGGPSPAVRARVASGGGSGAASRAAGEGGAPGPVCSGPLALRGGHAMPYCRWCGRIAGDWRCPHCGSARVRAVIVGARRTAEELGRAFPSVAVRTSGRDGVLTHVGPAPALVVATPGAEPVPEGGYAAVVLLDGWALLGRPDLRAGEEALRRWTNAAALARPGAELVVLADARVPVVQALLRWDPVTFAERELDDRAELGFPPAVRMAALTGPAAAVREMVADARVPGGAQVLGPVPVEGGLERAMIRVPRHRGAALAAALKAASGARSARKAADVVRVNVDPLDLV